MVFNWQEAITIFVTTVGCVGVCVPAVAWLSKALITHGFARNLKSFEIQLKANADAEIERVKNSLALDAKSFEMKLKADADAEIERLKNSLQIATLEHQIRFSKLHEKRAEVVADLYSRLVDLNNQLREEAYNFGDIPKNENGEPRSLPMMREFYAFFDHHRIYLPEKVCNLLDGFSKKAWPLIFRAKNSPTQLTIEEYYRFPEGMSAFEELPQARRELELEIRAMLGGPAAATDVGKVTTSF